MGVKERANSRVYCVTSVCKFSIAREFSNTMTQTNLVPSTATRCEMQLMMQVLGKTVGGGHSDEGWWRLGSEGGGQTKECFWVTQDG